MKMAGELNFVDTSDVNQQRFLILTLKNNTMEVQEILTQLKDKFGDSFDIAKVTSALKGLDLKNLNFSEIITKLKGDGLLENIHLDGLKDNVLDGLKSKAGGILGGMFGK